MNKIAIILLSLALFLQYYVSLLPKNPVKELHKICVTIKQGTSYGSGVIQRCKGNTYVWTANHVVKTGIGADTIEIIYQTYDKAEHTGILYFKAEVIASDKGLDLAILKVKHNKYFKHSASLYLEDEPPELGEVIWGVTSPYGDRNHNTTSTGILSQYDRTIDDKSFDQIDCSIAPGCSGGGIFLNDGRLIGILSMMRDNNMGFIVPVRTMLKWAKTTNLPKELYQ